jgi:large subunit ribosomal protein L24
MQRVTPRILRKRKEINRVRAAIRWAENTRKKKLDARKDRQEYLEAEQERLRWTSNVKIANEKHARQSYIEDWQLGTLRPKRNFGPEAERYGVVSGNELSFPRVAKHLRKTVSESPFQEGDRAVVIRGRDKGKIGEIKELHLENDTVTFSNDIGQVRYQVRPQQKWSY